MPSIKLTFPKAINVYEDVELHGEEPIVICDYTLEGTSILNIFTNWNYRNKGDDLKSDGTIDENQLNTTLKGLIFGVDGTSDYSIKNAGCDANKIELGERLLEIIAYTLFKHPMAKAPISNDAQIKGKQITIVEGVKEQFNMDENIRKSLVEQLFSQDPTRFSADDSHDNPVPIQKDDVIQFMIKYTGSTKSNQKTPDQTDIDFTTNDVIGTKLDFSILVKIILE